MKFVSAQLLSASTRGKSTTRREREAVGALHRECDANCNQSAECRPGQAVLPLGSDIPG